MANLDGIIIELRQQRDNIDRAIQALTGITSGASNGAQAKGFSSAPPKTRHVSAAARARMAAAQRAQWAKFRAAQKKK